VWPQSRRGHPPATARVDLARDGVDRTLDEHAIASARDHKTQGTIAWRVRPNLRDGEFVARAVLSVSARNEAVIADESSSNRHQRPPVYRRPPTNRRAHVEGGRARQRKPQVLCTGLALSSPAALQRWPRRRPPPVADLCPRVCVIGVIGGRCLSVSSVAHACRCHLCPSAASVADPPSA
jgi:hypothetical protein